MEKEVLVSLTADIVSAHVGHNSTAPGDVAVLIGTVFNALNGLGAPAALPAPEFTPAVTVRKSLANPAFIVSMIDGKGYSSLRRHLRTHGLTEAEYRQRYGLPATYPMVAAGYSEKRKALAIEHGLGRKPGHAPVPVRRGK